MTLTAAERRLRYGPSTGDRIRLADSGLWVRVAEDRQAAGDEPMWGYAKTIRPRIAQGRPSPSELDHVIVGVVVIDPVIGVVKADIGIKDGRIVGVGRAGNGERTSGIDLPIGPHTQPYAGYGLIATPGAVDSHVHVIGPGLIAAALSGGVTTLITAGFVEPPSAMRQVLQALDGWPVNIALQANARTEDDGSLEALLDAGACGFKVHEDYGSYPELIDRVLRFAETNGVTVSLHTDGLHETAELEDSVAAIAGRTVHAYHVEGTGGGHLPDLLGLVREPNIICSSTTPTIPYGINAVPEGIPMIVLNHGTSFDVAQDMALVRERVHPATMAAEGPLQELGAIGIVNSDSQGMGRIGETLRRTIQLADVMRAWRATEAGQGHPGLPVDPDDPYDSTDRVLRYLAKVTIEPAIVHGVSEHVGSLQAGRLADIVLWRPSMLGVKPEYVFKGGFYAWGPLGDGNASVERAEPTRYAPDWGGSGRTAASLSTTFVSARGAANRDLVAQLSAGGRRVVRLGRVRGLTRSDLVRNRATAPIVVDPGDGRVTLAGRPLEVEPVAELPLNRAYLLR